MKVLTDEKLIQELLARGVSEVIVLEDLRKKLLSGRKLRVKLGIDPTGSALHLGHAVALKKLREFQNLGHQVILLIGDYTAMIGDPSGRDTTRPILTIKKIKENEKTYVEQAAKILDIKKVEIRHNSEWYNLPDFTRLLMDLTSKITVARILERDDFQKRLKEDVDIQMQEIMYPLLQGYDSVALKADVELGGTDQKFNLLMGRKLQKKYGQEAQDVMTVPLLEGTDGVAKMSKSLGNYIGIMEEAEEIFGKIMSIPDNLIIKYFELCTFESLEKIQQIQDRLLAGENPRDIKFELAEAIVTLYHNKKEAEVARENFIKIFSQKEKPEEIPVVKITQKNIVDVLVESKLAESKSEARRLVEQKGVKVNDKVVEDINFEIKNNDIIQKGKRFFVKCQMSKF